MSPAKLSQHTPASLGYRMPAEWEPHDATWIAWPHNRADWPGKFEPVPWVYAEIVRHLLRSERVRILVNDEAAEVKAREVLVRASVLPDHALAPKSATSNLDFVRIPTNRVWTRDYGPIFLKKSSRNKNPGLPQVAATAWRFNAWGKYNDWQRDAPVSAELARRLRIPSWQPTWPVEGKPHRVVLEGGSIDVNGRGTLITTEECLLSEVQQRNPGMSRSDIEGVFRDYLGVKNVVWLDRGIAGDDTHGHVDDITRFVDPRTVLTACEDDPHDPNHQPLRDNYRKLLKSRDQFGKPLRVLKLPMPSPVHFRGQRLPASYANFYVANRCVLVPVFNDPRDRLALNVIAKAFPGREITGIYCGDFIWGLGALHCMTQQQPSGR